MRVSWFLALSVIPVVYCQTQSGCSYDAIGPDDTAILSDLSLPVTLTNVEVYYYSGCTQTVTALNTVYINGTAFTANPIVFSFASSETPLVITYNFPQVTLTSLTGGETLTFSETITGTDADADGGGEYTIVVPYQLYSKHPTTVTNTVSITSTVTAISTQPSGGFKPAAVGGIAAGIVGGFFLIGAIAFFLILRPKNREAHIVYPEERQAQMGEQQTKPLGSSNRISGRLSTA